MNASTAQNRKQIHNIAAFIGKRIDSTKWVIPAGYAKCEITGKLYPESQLERSFPHYFFNKDFLTSNHIYCEDAAWLSEEGEQIILSALDRLGVLEAYREAWDHFDDFTSGKCEIGATGLVWLVQRPKPAPAQISTVSLWEITYRHFKGFTSINWADTPAAVLKNNLQMRRYGNTPIRVRLTHLEVSQSVPQVDPSLLR